MAVLIHVLIALSSIIYSSLVLYIPTSRRLKISYGLIGATLASGTYLVISLPAHLVSACLSGLCYLVFTLSAAALAHYRLASSKKP